MRSNWRKIGDTWNELGIWNQFGLVFITAVLLLCSSLQVVA